MGVFFAKNGKSFKHLSPCATADLCSIKTGDNMQVIKLHNEIANDAWSDWFSGSEPFSLDYVQRIFAQTPEETDYKFDIHCLGGDVEEGLAIYDFLRTSGKNIYCNIEGGCHSMAVVLLLAAPKENRSANPNALALIHKVLGGAYGNIEDMDAATEQMRMLQSRVLDIYVDRTDLTRQEAEDIMDKENEHDVTALLKWGFISKINSYNTNTKFTMAKNAKSLKERTQEFLNNAKRLLGGVKNYDFLTEEGELLFSTEAEDDTLEVGMKASPDGTFTLLDGRVVVIADGEIKEVREFVENTIQNEEPSPEELAEHIEELEKENEQLKADLEAKDKEIEALKSQLGTAENLVKEYAKNTKSNYVPAERVNTPKKGTELSREERKNQVKENLKNLKKK